MYKNINSFLILREALLIINTKFQKIKWLYIQIICINESDKKKKKVNRLIKP